jgi:hypothetical protein
LNFCSGQVLDLPELDFRVQKKEKGLMEQNFAKPS